MRELNYDLKKIGSSDVSFQVVEDFKNDQNFLKQEGNLRKLILAIGRIYDLYSDLEPTASQHGQYHVALFVDAKVLYGEGTSDSYDSWRRIKASNKGDMKKDILGALVVHPLKEMYQEVINLEKESGELSHPVFDHNGVLRWPK